MNIITCIKQVPGTTEVNLDEDGNLIRDGVASKMNPYDLYALETSLRLKKKTNGKVTAISMGPPQAEKVIREAYMMGVDEGVLLTDRRFAGADVLATSYALSQCVSAVSDYDLVICGLMTTDGDTAQVGPAMAEHLGIPHVAGVIRIDELTADSVVVEYETSASVVRVRVKLPALLTVAKDINVPRLPSYRLKKATADKEIRWLTVDDMNDKTTERYGLNGSPTQVKRVFEPSHNNEKEVYERPGTELASILYDKLRAEKYI